MVKHRAVYGYLAVNANTLEVSCWEHPLCTKFTEIIWTRVGPFRNTTWLNPPCHTVRYALPTFLSGGHWEAAHGNCHIPQWQSWNWDSLGVPVLRFFSSMCFTTNHKLLSQTLLFDYFIPVDPPELPIYIYCCIFPSQVRQWWSWRSSFLSFLFRCTFPDPWLWA